MSEVDVSNVEGRLQRYTTVVRVPSAVVVLFANSLVCF